MYPYKRVLVSSEKPISFKVGETQFERIFTEEETKLLVGNSNGVNLYNGTSVRLDRVEGGCCYLSTVGFFDFLATNLAYLPESKKTERPQILDGAISYSTFFDLNCDAQLVRKLNAQVARYGSLSSFDKVLAVKEFANIVTVSILLEDCNGNFLLVKRGNRVAVSSSTFAVSAAGSVSDEDLQAKDPFLHCAQRELREELGITMPLELTDLVISKQKMQPAALFYGKIEQPFAVWRGHMVTAEDFDEENLNIFAVPRDCVADVLCSHQFTDVAAYQLATAVKLNRRRWLIAKSNMKIEQFRI